MRVDIVSLCSEEDDKSSQVFIEDGNAQLNFQNLWARHVEVFFAAKAC